VEIRNIMFDSPPPNLWKTPRVVRIILIIPILATQIWSDPIRPVEAAMPTCHQRRGIQSKSMTDESQTSNALALAPETTQLTV